MLEDIAFEIMMPMRYIIDIGGKTHKGELLSGSSPEEYSNQLKGFSLDSAPDYAGVRFFLDNHSVLFDDYLSIKRLNDDELDYVLHQVKISKLSKFVENRAVSSVGKYYDRGDDAQLIETTLDELKSDIQKHNDLVRTRGTFKYSIITRQLFKEEFIPYKHEQHSTCFKLN